MNKIITRLATARSSALPCVNFADASPDTFRGLKSLSVVFDAKPSRRAYYLTGAVTGLTDADVDGVTLSVTDEADNDYTENLTLAVKNGRLALTNAKPAGMYLIVR